mmetsp:Transcript_16913/g.55356  ORF Transcript_16913/g.55356 Transcript_16913/m.55356 type:complete len:244 (-) Transcript_16913:354-1085(-)
MLLFFGSRLRLERLERPRAQALRDGPHEEAEGKGDGVRRHNVGAVAPIRARLHRRRGCAGGAPALGDVAHRLLLLRGRVAVVAVRERGRGAQQHNPDAELARGDGGFEPAPERARRVNEQRPHLLRLGQLRVLPAHVRRDASLHEELAPELRGDGGGEWTGVHDDVPVAPERRGQRLPEIGRVLLLHRTRARPSPHPLRLRRPPRLRREHPLRHIHNPSVCTRGIHHLAQPPLLLSDRHRLRY